MTSLRSVRTFAGFFSRSYLDDIILKRAIERDLEIIDEAINRIIKDYPEVLLKNAKKIVGLRNQIIHVYDAISDAGP